MYNIVGFIYNDVVASLELAEGRDVQGTGSRCILAHASHATPVQLSNAFEVGICFLHLQAGLY